MTGFARPIASVRHRGQAFPLDWADFRVPLAVFAASQLLRWLVAYVAQILVPGNPSADAWHPFPRQLLLDALFRWDSGWYLLGAQSGYRFTPASPELAPTVLPLYPLLVRAFGRFGLTLPIAAILVSNLALASALVALYILLRRRFGPETASQSLVYLALAPFAFILGAADASSLLLALAIATFAALEAGRFVSAGLGAALAALTGPVGLALWPALVVAALARRDRPIGARLIGLACAPVALGAFTSYLHWSARLPVARISPTLLASPRPGVALPALIDHAASTGALALPFPVLLGLAIGLGAIAAVVPVARLLGVPYATFTFGSVLLLAATRADALGSGLAVVFPVFIVLAILIGSTAADGLVVLSSALLLGWLLALAASWYPVDRLDPAISPSRPLLERATDAIALADHPLHLRYGDQLDLLGYNLAATHVDGRDPLDLTVFVGGGGYRGHTYRLSARLSDARGRVWAEGDDLLGDTSRDWSGAAPPIERANLRIPFAPDAPSGAYRLDLLLFDARTAERLPLTDATTNQPADAALDTVVLLRPEDTATAAQLARVHPSNLDLGRQIRLRGFDLPAAAGQSVAVTLYWEARAIPDRDYTVFVQLLDPSGKLVAQSDGYPLDGRLPTSRWTPGEIIRDVHTLVVPAGARSETLTAIVGMYRLDTLARLGVRDSSGTSTGDHVVIGTMEVR